MVAATAMPAMAPEDMLFPEVTRSAFAAAADAKLDDEDVPDASGVGAGTAGVMVDELLEVDDEDEDDDDEELELVELVVEFSEALDEVSEIVLFAVAVTTGVEYTMMTVIPASVIVTVGGSSAPPDGTVVVIVGAITILVEVTVAVGTLVVEFEVAAASAFRALSSIGLIRLCGVSVLLLRRL